jgi:hypothetical protein
VKLAARTAQSSQTASFATPGHPSVVAWLKDLKAAGGNPIRGGKYWTALAGAAGVDDSGTTTTASLKLLVGFELIVDESMRAETPGLPDDIAILVDRRNHLECVGSSFL